MLTWKVEYCVFALKSTFQNEEIVGVELLIMHGTDRMEANLQKSAEVK